MDVLPPLPNDFLLSVIMPVYNEQSTLREIVDAVLAEPTRKELILVDDGSFDESCFSNVSH